MYAGSVPDGLKSILLLLFYEQGCACNTHRARTLILQPGRLPSQVPCHSLNKTLPAACLKDKFLLTQKIQGHGCWHMPAEFLLESRTRADSGPPDLDV